jgi:hypothetical protein
MRPRNYLQTRHSIRVLVLCALATLLLAPMQAQDDSPEPGELCNIQFCVDIDRDGFVRATDLIYVINRIGDSDFTADIDKDGNVSAADVDIMLEYIGLELPLPQPPSLPQREAVRDPSSFSAEAEWQPEPTDDDKPVQFDVIPQWQAPGEEKPPDEEGDGMAESGFGEVKPIPRDNLPEHPPELDPVVDEAINELQGEDLKKYNPDADPIDPGQPEADDPTEGQPPNTQVNIVASIERGRLSLDYSVDGVPDDFGGPADVLQGGWMWVLHDGQQVQYFGSLEDPTQRDVNYDFGKLSAGLEIGTYDLPALEQPFADNASFRIPLSGLQRRENLGQLEDLTLQIYRINPAIETNTQLNVDVVRAIMAVSERLYSVEMADNLGQLVKPPNLEVVDQETGELVEIAALDGTANSNDGVLCYDGSCVNYGPRDPEVTQLGHKYPSDEAIDLVILGDGFQEDEQDVYNDWVQENVMEGMFDDPVFNEARPAFNIHRINLYSRDSGVDQYDPETGEKIVVRSTALGWGVNGRNAQCWNQGSGNGYTGTAREVVLANLVPEWDQLVTVLNDTSFGACARGRIRVTMHLINRPDVLRHEFGHTVGKLGDEYISRDPDAPNPRDYTDGEPSDPNLTTRSTLSSLTKWDEFVEPGTPIFTDNGDVSGDEDHELAGLFEGGSVGAGRGFDTGLHRPTFRSTMHDNRINWGPVNEREMRDRLRDYYDSDFNQAYVGDWNGDGQDDLALFYDYNAISMYLSTGNELVYSDTLWDVTDRWHLTGGDRFQVADFNGDGKDDLYVFNTTTWSDNYVGMIRSNGTEFESIARYGDILPGWGTLRDNDQFFVGDFDGDGDDDLYIFNGKDWSTEYLGMVRSSGNSLRTIRIWGDTLRNWDMKSDDQFFVGNFFGEDTERPYDDLMVLNQTQWIFPYIGLYQSTGNSLSWKYRHDGTLENWQMKSRDEFHVADVNGDNVDDIYIMNLDQWCCEYLWMGRSDGQRFRWIERYTDDAPDDFQTGWAMRDNDQFYVADVDGNGFDDLVIFNRFDWNDDYIAILRNVERNGKRQLSYVSLQGDVIGGWRLSDADRILIGNFNGGGGWSDIFIRNSSWFGLMRSRSGSFTLDAIYPRWITEVNYHEFSWWDG